MKIQFLTLCVFVMSSFTGLASEIKGRIINEMGERLAGVSIYSHHVRGGIVGSDEKGAFSVPETKVLFFRHNGYILQTKIIDSPTFPLVIVMVNSKKSGIVLPECSTANKKENFVGVNLNFHVPKDATSHRETDDDYSYFVIYKKFGEREVELSGISGSHASRGVPPEEWILNSVDFSEQCFKNKPQLSDLRGKLKDGTYWRFIGVFGTSIKYSGLSKDEAAYVDKIISSACI